MNDNQLLRYSRQIMLDGFDIEGQQRLLDAKVLIVGLGGLGCPAALYLAAAGVGELWLADDDSVELSNLQRQIAHNMADLNQPKVISAAAAVAALNPDVAVELIHQRLLGDLLDEVVTRVDLVLDASDNFATRFALNRACVAHRVPLVSAAAIRSEGQVIVFDSRNPNSPCYRCLYDDKNAEGEELSCAENGVLSPLVGIIGSMEALEAVKVLSGFGQPLLGQLMIFDAKVMEWRKLSVSRNPTCPVCSAGSF